MAAHRQAGNARRQARPDQRHPSDVVALLAIGLAAAEDDFFDFRRVQLRRFSEQVLDAVGGQVVRPGQIKRAAK